MPTLSRVAFMLATAVVSTASLAAFTAPPSFNIAATIGDRNSDVGDYDTGLGLKLGYSRPINQYFDLSIFASALDYKSDSSDDFQQTAIGVEAAIFTTRDSGFQPYFVIATGLQRTAFSGASGDVQNNFVDAGFGFKQQLSKSGLALQTDVRMRRDFFDDTTRGTTDVDDVIAHVGLSIPVGSQSSDSSTEYQSKQLPDSLSDSDADGVQDTTDYCPATQTGAAVDVNGCSREQHGLSSETDAQGSPATSAVTSAPTPTSQLDPGNRPGNDHDADGVENHLDSCPGTASTAPVDLSGCSDKQLAETPAAVIPEPTLAPSSPTTPAATPKTAPAPLSSTEAAVEAPAAEPQQATSRTTSTSTSAVIVFIGTTLELTAEGQSQIATIARELLHHRDATASIQGAAESNDGQNLGYRRAKTIKNKLLRYGINGSRLKIDGTSNSGLSVVELRNN